MRARETKPKERLLCDPRAHRKKEEGKKKCVVTAVVQAGAHLRGRTLWTARGDEVSRHTSEKPKGIPAFKGAVGGDSGERRCVPRLFDALI